MCVYVRGRVFALCRGNSFVMVTSTVAVNLCRCWGCITLILAAAAAAAEVGVHVRSALSPPRRRHIYTYSRAVRRHELGLHAGGGGCDYFTADVASIVSGSGGCQKSNADDTARHHVASGCLVLLLAVGGSHLAVFGNITCRWHHSGSSLLERVQPNVSAIVDRFNNCTLFDTARRLID